MSATLSISRGARDGIGCPAGRDVRAQEPNLPRRPTDEARPVVRPGSSEVGHSHPLETLSEARGGLRWRRCLARVGASVARAGGRRLLRNETDHDWAVRALWLALRNTRLAKLRAEAWAAAVSKGWR